MSTTEDIFYQIGKFAFLPFTAGMLFLNRSEHAVPGKLSGCVFRELTGYACPGCGGTRSLRALAHGQPVQAFLYHPLVPYAVAAYLIFMAVCFYRRHISRKTGYRPIRAEYLFYVGIVILLIQWILKNLGVLAF